MPQHSPRKVFRMKFFYDLHLHSCLSPCGSEDMTPADLAAMCALAGLDIVALTDHNTCGNCAAFCRAAEARGLLALAGMELCTAEEIHVICLFPDTGRAEEFGRLVYGRLPPIANRPEIFGRQLYMDDGDGVLGEEPRFLGGASSISLAEVPGLAASCGGTAFPAHIDRPSFSLLGVLGLWEPSLGFPWRRCPDAVPGRCAPAGSGGGAADHQLRRPLPGAGVGGGARHGAAPAHPRRRAGLAAGAPSPICRMRKPPLRSAGRRGGFFVKPAQSTDRSRPSLCAQAKLSLYKAG